MEKNTFGIKKLFISKIQTSVQKEYYPNLYKHLLMLLNQNNIVALSFGALSQLF